MTLTNYWLLLIWLFVGGFLCSSMPKRHEHLNDRTVERWDMLPVLILVVPYIVWAGFRHDYFGDTSLYRRTYLALSSDLSQAFSVFLSDTKDPGFTALSIVLKSVIGNSDKIFFLIIAAFQMLCVSWVFRKYSDNFWTSIFLFVVSTDYLSWMHNGIRQFIAVAMIFAAFDLLVKKRYIPLIAVILLASTIHGSALLMIPIIFVVQGRAWNSKTILMLSATAVVILFVDRFTPFLDTLLQDTQYSDMTTNEVWATDDGTNIIRVLVYAVPSLLSLLGLKYIRAANNPVMNICINCSIVTTALYLVASVTSGIYIGRLPIYTTLQGYIALPWIIDQVFERRSAQLVHFCMYGAYLLFFYYQMHFTWGVI